MTGCNHMLTTVGDVKVVAQKVWPEAAQFNVQIVAANNGTPKRYRLSAISVHRSVLGHVSAADLPALRESLETRLSRKNVSESVDDPLAENQ